MQRDIQLRRRERDRPHEENDVLPQMHSNNIGECPPPRKARASLERWLLGEGFMLGWLGAMFARGRGLAAIGAAMFAAVWTLAYGLAAYGGSMSESEQGGIGLVIAVVFVLTMRSDRQLVATDGNGCRLSGLIFGQFDLRPVATGCNHGAP